MMRRYEGQALPLALAAMAVGALLTAPFMGAVSVHSIGSHTYSDSILQQYAGDGGIEDAIWRLTSGDLVGVLAAPGDTVSYSPDESLNGIQPSVAITRKEGATEAYEIVSAAGDETIRVNMLIDDGDPAISTWRAERRVE